VSEGRRYVLGLDGCRGGWVGVRLDAGGAAPPVARRYRTFHEALDDADRPAVIAVDMPIGFLDVASPGGRACEQLARKAVRARRASVFSAPARAALAYAHDYRAALDANRAGGGVGLSRQSFHLIPKMVEIDALLSPAGQARVRECHPELAFTVLNGDRPMRFAKKTPPGRVERIGVLEATGRAFGLDRAFLDSRRHDALKGGGVGRDDLIDAAVAALTALRILRGKARSFPAEPPRDAKGLKMEIVA
jgi:predicted RNase H-like nuclease